MNTLRILARTVALVSLALLAGAGCTNTDTVAQKLPIGSACNDSSECGSPPHFFCDSEHPGGYCKKDCKGDADCPSEAICAFDGAVGACHLKCDTSSNCRFSSGYQCKPASSNQDTLASHAYCDAPEGNAPDAAVPMDQATGG